MMLIKILLVLSMKCTFMYETPSEILACQEEYNKEIIKAFDKLSKECKEK